MDRPPWFLDEVAHAGDEHLDPAYVATYNDKAHVDPTEDLALLRTLGLNKRSVLVDLGAGSGAFALAAAAVGLVVVTEHFSSLSPWYPGHEGPVSVLSPSLSHLMRED